MSVYNGLAYSSQVAITFSLSVESKMLMDSGFYHCDVKNSSNVFFDIGDNDRV